MYVFEKDAKVNIRRFKHSNIFVDIKLFENEERATESYINTQKDVSKILKGIKGNIMCNTTQVLPCIKGNEHMEIYINEVK